MAYVRFIFRLLLAALFLFAGTVHLLKPDLFLPIMPPWVPFHLPFIELSGVCQLLGGLGLLIPTIWVQRLTGIGLTLLLVAVFPANVYMAAEHIQVLGVPSQPWMAWARLPIQPLLIVAVLWVTYLYPGSTRKISTGSR